MCCCGSNASPHWAIRSRHVPSFYCVCPKQQLSSLTWSIWQEYSCMPNVFESILVGVFDLGLIQTIKFNSFFCDFRNAAWNVEPVGARSVYVHLSLLNLVIISPFTSSLDAGSYRDYCGTKGCAGCALPCLLNWYQCFTWKLAQFSRNRSGAHWLAESCVTSSTSNQHAASRPSPVQCLDYMPTTERCGTLA